MGAMRPDAHATAMSAPRQTLNLNVVEVLHMGIGSRNSEVDTENEMDLKPGTKA